MNLYELFLECIRIPYLKVGEDTNYAVRREKDTLFIFFQASIEATDWKRNLNFPAKPYKRMGKTVWFAHRGFLQVWKELEPILADEITDRTVKKIIVTGYSHGAALAVLCHEYVWFRRPDLRKSTEGYGFGCPRVFWGIQTPNLKRRWENFTVIRNINDLVTHVPPVFMGYSHVGTLLKIGGKGRYTAIEAHFSENILKELRAYEIGIRSSFIQNNSMETTLAKGAPEVKKNSLSPVASVSAR